MLYCSKKNPVELKHCETSRSCRVFYLMKLKPEKESYYLILVYDYVTIPRNETKRNETNLIDKEITVHRVNDTTKIYLFLLDALFRKIPITADW